MTSTTEFDAALAPARDVIAAQRSEPDTSVGYVQGILSHDISTELGRLQLLESQVDPATHAVLEARGIADGGRFLEIGAGAGSVAYWLADRFPGGEVTAVDVSTSFLDDTGRSNLRIVQADVRTHDFEPGSFDLIHARTVLMHIPEREEVLRRLVSWLAPGGWLVTEDLVLSPVDSSPHDEFRHAFEAIGQAMASSIGSDLWWGRTLPAPLTRAGLVDAGLHATYYPVGGSNEIGRLWRATFSQSADYLVASGLLTRADLDSALALLADPDFLDLGPSIIAAWGRRPPA
ncbi:hypothetical protein ThrDRAFT_02479 [Frankia casuarinae]|uniref:Methyltransferase n=2 Tax=Frankia TaxID=1854 RepID=Q2J9C0_FRACC|nr:MULTISPECIES: class I SAM-dependent methyltransferase [Frankia]ABD12122.1 putative methyltransferase [Frankia casuarinae]ETA00519.1 hypothetical protein CcI6DRAFT_04043 [Frankia sp. CcI6]EYT91834.1 hypothetical protein ThrDRAFT_02479 [Frankia casuarinae]KEZ34826.1 methyltransferase family protein [Frankia sp. CeD]KFB03236.1 methyltransferase family protein [Frankia sp. Allo2]